MLELFTHTNTVQGKKKKEPQCNVPYRKVLHLQQH